MRTLFTGATGVIGRRAIPHLVAEGHEVNAVCRSEEDRIHLEEVGAKPVRVDLFNSAEVDAAVKGMDAVIHFATAIPKQSEMRQRSSWLTNDRLRSESTALLVDGAIRGGVSRFIQESVSFVYADGGQDWLDESSPVAPVWDVLDSAIDAEQEVRRFQRAGGTGVILRMSRLYGPADVSGQFVEGVRHRAIPLIGSGRNYVSSLHIEDAATAVAASMTAPGGTFNVSDDEPVTSADDMAALVAAIGAPEPHRAAAAIARIAAGKAVRMLTVSHRVSNRAYKEASGWEPRYPSVREGWPASYGQTMAA